jgi:hypothetical protein
MLNIEIKTIPHKEQRYPTTGDYFRDGKRLCFRVSEIGNKKYELLVAVHELVERILCDARGITDREIDRFEMVSEAKEPGDDPNSPCHQEHVFASGIERLLAHELGVEWDDYENSIDQLYEEVSSRQ